MPAPIRAQSLTVYATSWSSPSQISPAVLDAIRSHPGPCNVILPYIEKALIIERNGGTFSDDTVWIASFTIGKASSPTPTLDFLLSCTDGPIGKYPIFIYSARSVEEITDAWLSPRITCLVGELEKKVHPERVFSVFAVEPVSNAFACTWSRYTGVAVEPEAYYAAKYTFCTRKTFRNRQTTVFPGEEICLRKAREDDAEKAARLCEGFASTSAPFLLTPEGAMHEAQHLIANGQLWVHEVKRADKSREIASIVAVTRESKTVSTVSKVYTNPAWRKRGCAERLVRAVCKELLYKQGKEAVVLYVAHDNPAAAGVYSRVGFVGISTEAPVPGVEPWLELGFDQRVIRLGHW